MITTVDQRTFYLDGYNPIATMTIEYNEDINLKYWISKVLNVPVNEIISPKTLMKILRDYQAILPKQVVPRIGKSLSTPNSFFYLYLKAMMLFDYNPVTTFNKNHHSLFNANSCKDIFARAIQKYIDPVTYLYSAQIISLLALTEARMQILKRHRESNKNFLKAFQKLIGYEIVFNSAEELSVMDLKGLTDEVEYMALSFITTSIHEKPEDLINKIDSLPTIILKIPEGVILFNTPRIIRSFSETLEKIYQAPFQTNRTPYANIVTAPPTGMLIMPGKDIQKEEINKNNEEEEIISKYNKIKKIPLTGEQKSFITSGNMELEISEPDEEFPSYL